MTTEQTETSGYETDNISAGTFDETATYNTETECEYVGFMDKLTDDEMAEAELEINERIDEYILSNAVSMSHPDFIAKAVNEITEQLLEEWVHIDICNDSDEEELKEWVETLVDLYLETMDIPKRQEPATACEDEPDNFSNQIACSQEKLEYLKNVSKHSQKSVEWHNMRKNMITASNAWKAFSTDAQKNSLIYEKCKACACASVEDGASSGDGVGMEGLNRNLDSTLHWGQKYEPVSIQIYEKKTGAKVDEYGCIIHEKYPFIGASPDGIVSSGKKMGTMIEIKNIVNRNITGIPLDAYWIQMQIQMEVCDLDICDFIETRFKEYETEREFYEMAESGIQCEHGVMSLFYARDGCGELMYKYMPLHIRPTRENVKVWMDTTQAEVGSNWVHYGNTYWYLDEYMCTTVKRNKFWFQHAVDVLEETWKTIEHERVAGYEHRMPKKRGGGQHALNANLLNHSLLGEGNWSTPIGECDGREDREIVNIMMSAGNFHVIKRGQDGECIDE